MLKLYKRVKAYIYYLLSYPDDQPDETDVFNQSIPVKELLDQDTASIPVIDKTVTRPEPKKCTCCKQLVTAYLIDFDYRIYCIRCSYSEGYDPFINPKGLK